MPGVLPNIYHPRAVVTLTGQADPVIPIHLSAIPKSAEVARNAARKADTARVVLDYRDFPMDPRGIRDLLITIHMEDSVVPSLPTIPTPLNKRFAGIVDSIKVERSDRGDFVTMEARDFTAVWLGFRWSPLVVINLLAPLSSVVEFLRFFVVPETLPAIFTSPQAAALIPGLRMGRTTYTVKKDADAWSILNDILAPFGLIAEYDIDILTIRTPARSTLDARQVVYGQNVKRLSFSRSMSREPATKGVVINAWNPVTGIPTAGAFIPLAARVKTNSKGVQVPKVATQVVYNVEGQYTVAELTFLAKTIYDEDAQQQIEGDLETRDMADSLLLPMLGLKNGDTLTCVLGRDLSTEIEGKTPAEAVAYLSNPSRPNPITPAVATILVQAHQQAQVLGARFYVREAVHTWDRESGYSLRVRFQNFILGVA